MQRANKMKIIKSNVPLVSVLICTYNAERFIEANLLSVLDQTYKHIEVLILDNNSQDSTVRIVNSFSEKDERIKLFPSNENLGAYGGLNYLLQKAKGEYIAIQDHDDIWHSKKLEFQIKLLENHNEYVGCGTLTIEYFENISAIKFPKVKSPSNFSPHPSLVFRNQGYYYDTSVLYKTDTYFMKYILCNKKNRLYNLQKYLCIHRVRADGNNLSNKLLNITNIFAYYNKTKDYRRLIYGLVRCIIPLYLRNFIDSHISIGGKIRKVDYLSNDDFAKEYLRYF